MHRIHWTKRLTSGAVTMLLASGLGCGLISPKLPPAEPGFRREEIREGGFSCWRGPCRRDIRIAGVRMRSVEEVRVVSEKELGASLGERMVLGALGVAIRSIGASTVEGVITVGKRTITDSSTSRQLDCDIAWIDNEERKREGGETVTTRKRVADAMDCRVAGADSAQMGTWRFRSGAPTSLDSLKRIKDTLGIEPPYATALPIVLERTMPNGERTSYAVQVASKSNKRILFTTTWTFTRPDGVVIGTLQLITPGHCYKGCALDLREADEHEAAILRLVATTLTIPLY
jgi:hypothetical protein